MRWRRRLKNRLLNRSSSRAKPCNAVQFAQPGRGRSDAIVPSAPLVMKEYAARGPRVAISQQQTATRHRCDAYSEP